MVSAASINAGAVGQVTLFGLVTQLDTNATTEGSVLYLSAATAGARTDTVPAAPNYEVRIGTVDIQSTTVGKVVFHPSEPLSQQVILSENAAPTTDAVIREMRQGLTTFNGVPSTGQDSTQGYTANKSRVIDYNTQIEYLCTSAGVGAAVWAVVDSVESVSALPDSAIDNTDPKNPIIIMPITFLPTAPDQDNDASENYQVGSEVKALDTGVTHLCIADGIGAAEWIPLSGEWTPTLTPDGSTISAATLTSATYQINGNMMTIGLDVIIDTTINAGNGSVEFDVPFEIDTTVKASGYSSRTQVSNDGKVGIVDESNLNFQITSSEDLTNAALQLSFIIIVKLVYPIEIV
jgi:hypothetical protein